MIETNLALFLMTGAALLEIAAPFFGFAAILKSSRSRTPVREAARGIIGVCLFIGGCHFYWQTGFFIGEGVKAVVAPQEVWPVAYLTRSFTTRAVPNRLEALYSELRGLSSKNEGRLLPPLADVPGRLMHGGGFLNGYSRPRDYVSFTHPRFYQLYFDPIHRQKKYADDWSWFYLGYAVRNDEQMQAFADIYKARVDTGQGFDEDVPSPAFADGFMRRLSLRLPELPPDAKRPPLPSELERSDVPVLIGRVEHYDYRGAHVLYLDGRTEFIEYPGKWPMTQKTVALLDGLDAMGEQSGGVSE